ncbi:membrane dipeptidase [bacterium]|nr:membrane dipeptidase [bacterium]
MPLPEGMFIADAHQDIACHCQEMGREFVDPGDVPCMITLPLLQQADVRLLCATLFTPHDKPEPERRYKLHSQYEMYQQWFADYREEFVPVRSRAELSRLASAKQVKGVRNPETGVRKGYPIGVILLMEGCDLLSNPAELQTWWDRGVRIASLTWNGTNRYASGCFADGKGLKPLGIELLKEFRRLGMILDLSHLNYAGSEEALALFDGPVCATHSDARALANHERNLTDGQAREIGRRGGVMGLNLMASFIIAGWKWGNKLPEVSQATEHTVHLAGIAGWEHVGIGSDLDGGLTPENTPRGIERVDHLWLLTDDLRARGCSESEVAGFAGANWWRFFEHSLPR